MSPTLNKTKNKQSHFFFLKENNSFKPNLDVISVERNGKWGRGCQRFLKVFTTQKAQVTEHPNVQLTKRTLWRGKGRKANGIATGNQAWYCSSAKLESQKGGRLLGQHPVIPEQWNRGSHFCTAQRGRAQKLDAEGIKSMSWTGGWSPGFSQAGLGESP